MVVTDWICDPFSDHGEEQVIDQYYVGDNGTLNWDWTIFTRLVAAEILGHIVPSRTNVLDQVSGMGQTSVISSSIDLNSNYYDYSASNFDHSAQFCYQISILE